jgi:ketosteroid isomerase-like protein
MRITEIEHVRRFYDAVAAGELHQALALLGDRVRWHEAPGMPYRAERAYRGAEQVAERVLGPINTDVENLRLHVDMRVPLGPHVAVLGRYEGVARASRRPVDQPFAHMWTFDADGRVSEFRQYTDAERFVEAIRT